MKPVFTARRLGFAFGIAALAMTAGCKSSTPEPVPADNGSNFVETSNVLTETNVLEPVTPAPVVNVTTPAPAATSSTNEFGSAEQTQEDAEATGMTSKLPQDEETQPAEKQ